MFTACFSFCRGFGSLLLEDLLKIGCIELQIRVLCSFIIDFGNRTNWRKGTDQDDEEEERERESSEEEESGE